MSHELRREPLSEPTVCDDESADLDDTLALCGPHAAGDASVFGRGDEEPHSLAHERLEVGEGLAKGRQMIRIKAVLSRYPSEGLTLHGEYTLQVWKAGTADHVASLSHHSPSWK